MKKTTTLISLLLFIVNVGLSQFSQLKQRPAINQSNLLHSCIAKSSSNSSFYILATTVQVGNTNNIALQKLDTNGITIWEKEVFYSSDDKVLDVIVDKKDDIIIVGYTQKTGKKQWCPSLTGIRLISCQVLVEIRFRSFVLNRERCSRN